MDPVIKPTVGRIVHYKSRGSADGIYPPTDRAAVVTDVMENATIIDNSGGHMVEIGVRLAVLSPEGMFFTGWLEQGDLPGMWNWPARV